MHLDSEKGYSERLSRGIDSKNECSGGLSRTMDGENEDTKDPIVH